MANPKPSKSWKKGIKSPNPKGAPKRNWTWSGELQKAVEAATGNKQQIKELVAKSMVREALKGDVHAINSLMNRMDGFPLQPTDLTTQGNKLEGIKVTIVEEKKDKSNE